MKHALSLIVVLLVCLQMMAVNRYVSTKGNNTKDGHNWRTALLSIDKAIASAEAGDTIFVASGVYKQTFTVKSGVCVLGSCDPKKNVRSVVNAPSVLNAEGLNRRIITADEEKYLSTTIDGFVLQNAYHNDKGGAAFLSHGVTLNNCIIELCVTSSAGGAIYNRGGNLSHCTIRGCKGQDAIVYNDANGIIDHCLIHNNEPSRNSWPNSGSVYNPREGNRDGKVFSCISVCNYGEQYGGFHSESVAYNNVCWNNPNEEGFSDPSNYISDEATRKGAGNNASDDGFQEINFPFLLAKDNFEAKGPQFVAPTTFVGAPTSDIEIAAMRAADFRLMPSSYLVGLANQSTLTGNVGVADDGLVTVAVTKKDKKIKKITLMPDTLTVVEGNTALLFAFFNPNRVIDKRLIWQSKDRSIVTVDKWGKVTGITEGVTTIKVHPVFRRKPIATAIVKVTKKPLVKIHKEVLDADANYRLEDYTIPSFIPFLIAKEAARKDSSAANIALLRQRILELRDKKDPYNLVATVNGDPKTRMAFCWFTNGDVRGGDIQLLKVGTTDTILLDAQSFTTRPLRYAVSNSGILKAANLPSNTTFTYVSHKALIESLTPGTDYIYRAGMPGHWTPFYHFRTADAHQEEYSFVYMTDSHLMDAEYMTNAYWCAKTVQQNEPEARFCLFPGDFVESGSEINSEWEWEKWFDYSLQPVVSSMPIVPTDGNHDDSPNLNYTYHFNTDCDFDYTAQYPPQFKGTTYSFVYGDVLFLVYSHQDYWRAPFDYDKGTSEFLQKDMATWFRSQVAQHPECKWRIALVHQNVFSGAGHQTDEAATIYRSCMLPIFKELEIDMVVQGHDHCYEIIGPIDPETRTMVKGAVTNVKRVTADSVSNVKGKLGGTYCVDDGILYFVGATCGRKRYNPFSKEKMEVGYPDHKVDHYYDLFTVLGQPGAPSYSRFTVHDNYLEINSYTANETGEATLFNTFKVVRTRPHKSVDLTAESAIYQPVAIKGPWSMKPTTSSINILWQTADNRPYSVVYYGTTKELGDSVVSETGNYVEGEGFVHDVQIPNLQSNTVYYYQIGNGNKRYTDICSTRTAPEEGTAFRIFSISDIHGNSYQNWENMQQSICDLNPNIAICVGDFVPDNGADRFWSRYFFGPGRQFLAQVPIMSAIGNHETGVPQMYRYSHFYDYFHQFSHGYSEDPYRDTRGEAYFTFPYGNAQIICININGDESSPAFGPGSRQYRWLDRTLEASTAKWIFIYGHVGIYTTGWHGNWSEDQKQIAPLFEKYAAQGKSIIYFCGDDHSFEHLYKDGVHYVRPGCGRDSNYDQQTHLIDYEYSKCYKKVSCYSTIDMSADGETVSLTAHDSASNVIYTYDFKRNQVVDVSK